MPMDQRAALEVIAAHRGNRVVMPTMGAISVWPAFSDTALDFAYMPSSMGQGPALAHGLALARPAHGVISLTGDGSLLMNLGTLVSTAEAAPKNLFHFVCENGTYEANGGHPIPGRGSVSFAGMARSAGYKSVHELADLIIFEQQVGAILAEQGPVFTCLKIVSSGAQERDYSRLHGPHVRKAFRDALAAG